MIYVHNHDLHQWQTVLSPTQLEKNNTLYENVLCPVTNPTTSTTYAAEYPTTSSTCAAEIPPGACLQEYSSNSSIDYYSDSDNDPNFVVSESDSVSEDEQHINNIPVLDNISPQKSRKRQWNPKKWKCNERKQRRMTGLEYISKNNKRIPAKSLKPPCLTTCKKQCLEKNSQVNFRQFLP